MNLNARTPPTHVVYLEYAAASSTILTQDEQNCQTMYKCSENRITRFDNNRSFVLRYLEA